MLARTSPVGVGKSLNPFRSELLGVHPKTPLHSQHGPPRIAMLAIPLEKISSSGFLFRDFLGILFRSDGAMEVTSLIGRLSRMKRIASYNCWLRVVLVCSRVRLENS